MKAIGYRTPGPIDRAEALEDVDLPRPRAEGRDLLVEVAAISVNPVDTKVRKSAAPEPGEVKVLGWDAVGRVAEVGREATGFQVGDEVFYAGSITPSRRERRVPSGGQPHRRPQARHPHQRRGRGPAADRDHGLGDAVRPPRHPPSRPGAADAILIVGGAGGVGSIAIQLVRALTDVTVIATASRPETQDWVRELGAHHVVDHTQPMAAQVEALGLGAPGLRVLGDEGHRHVAEIAALIAPQGRFGLIDDPVGLDVMGFKRKAVSIHWELMFTRAIFETPDMDEQGKLLAEVARLVDAGRFARR